MYCLLMMGLGLLSFSLYAGLQYLHLRRHGIIVTAKVIPLSGKPRESHEERKRVRYGKEPRLHHFGLVVRYSPPDDEPVDLDVSTGRQLGLRPGDKVQVLFNPAKPTSACFPDENLLVGPILLGIIGLAVTGLGLYAVG
jgi:hypothetical protein